MKVEGKSESAIQASYGGQAKQVHNETITAVLLQDGWHEIKPGSFGLFKTPGNVPFVRFDMALWDNNEAHTVEIFPNSLYGVAYPKEITEGVSSTVTGV